MQEVKTEKKVSPTDSMIGRQQPTTRTIVLTYGNTYKHLEKPRSFTKNGMANEHQWGCYVRIDDPDDKDLLPFLFDQATFWRMNPRAATKPSVINLDMNRPEKPLEIKCTGWDIYDIDIILSFHRALADLGAKDVNIVHGLVFAPGGSQSQFSINIPIKAYQKACEMRKRAVGDD